VHGLQSFNPSVESGLVSIEVKFSGVIIDESPVSEKNRRFTTSSAPLTMILKQSYDILTSAEQATYKF
jgi:hypothetical protein